MFKKVVNWIKSGFKKIGGFFKRVFKPFKTNKPPVSTQTTTPIKISDLADLIDKKLDNHLNTINHQFDAINKRITKIENTLLNPTNTIKETPNTISSKQEIIKANQLDLKAKNIQDEADYSKLAQDLKKYEASFDNTNYQSNVVGGVEFNYHVIYQDSKEFYSLLFMDLIDPIYFDEQKIQLWFNSQLWDYMVGMGESDLVYQTYINKIKKEVELLTNEINQIMDQ